MSDHVWVERTYSTGTQTECRYGDAVKRRDGKHKPCRGPARIDLRADTSSPDLNVPAPEGTWDNRATRRLNAKTTRRKR